MKRRIAIKNMALIGGSAALAAPLLTLLESCQSKSRIDWKPVFLSENHALLISSLVDTVLPATDTPGGLDVKTDMFLDLVFSQLYDEEGQESLKSDMDEFEEKCKNAFGKKFNQLSLEQKGKILRAEESDSARYNGSVWGTAVGEQKPVGFYRSIKSMMLWGYFTSEEIGKNILNYDPIPGDYLGCIPLSDVGKIWSL